MVNVRLIRLGDEIVNQWFIKKGDFIIWSTFNKNKAHKKMLFLGQKEAIRISEEL